MLLDQWYIFILVSNKQTDFCYGWWYESSWKGWLMILQGQCWKVAVTDEFFGDIEDWSTSWSWRLVNILKLRIGQEFLAEVWSIFWSSILIIIGVLNLCYDLKAISWVKALNAWVHFAFSNVSGSFVHCKNFTIIFLIMAMANTTLPKSHYCKEQSAERKIITRNVINYTALSSSSSS